MSASRLSLKNPIVIGVVVVLGIAVTILNVQTFGKGRLHLPSRRVQAGHQDEPSLPSDLATLVRDTDKAMTLASSGVGGTAGDQPQLKRDPFLGRIKPAPVRRRAASPKVNLSCSAVVLGGSGPVAVINGKRLAVGENIGGMTVTSVDTRAVVLRNSSGRKQVLAVGGGTGKTGGLQMEFKNKKTDKTNG